MTFWSDETMRQRVPTEGLVRPYNEQRHKNSAYELSLGNEAFISGKSNEVKVTVKENGQVSIPPGQFGIVLTEEEVTIPPDAIGFISIRAGWKFRGLVNVSGFHVDPGFTGRLKFSVYNAGHNTVVLPRGESLFMIWFSSLDKPTESLYISNPTRTNQITGEDVMKISGGVPSRGELYKEFIALRDQQKTIIALAISILVAIIGVFVASFNGKQESEVKSFPEFKCVQENYHTPTGSVTIDHTEPKATDNETDTGFQTDSSTADTDSEN